MFKLMEVFQRPTTDEVIIPCHCGFGHYVVFGVEGYEPPFEPGGAPLEWEVHLVEEYRPTRDLWGRIKGAFHILFGSTWHTAGVGLNRSDVKKVNQWSRRILDGKPETKEQPNRPNTA